MVAYHYEACIGLKSDEVNDARRILKEAQNGTILRCHETREAFHKLYQKKAGQEANLERHLFAWELGIIMKREEIEDMREKIALTLKDIKDDEDQLDKLRAEEAAGGANAKEEPVQLAFSM